MLHDSLVAVKNEWWQEEFVKHMGRNKETWRFKKGSILGSLKGKTIFIMKYIEVCAVYAGEVLMRSTWCIYPEEAQLVCQN